MTETELGQRQAQLESIVADTLKQAAQLGASQAEVSGSAGAGLSVTVRKQATETL